MLYLRRPTLEDKEAIEEMLREFQEMSSSTNGFWYSEDRFDFEGWIRRCQLAEQGLGLPSGAVPYIQYVSCDVKGNLLGFLNLRLALNEKLLAKGGHIGYSIRPSERQKGYGKEQLRLGLVECLCKNIKDVLITCSEDNDPSRRLILGQGGILENTLEGTERYWIRLEVDREQSQASGMEE